MPRRVAGGSSRPASAAVTWDGWQPPAPLAAGPTPRDVFAPLPHHPMPADVHLPGTDPWDIPWLASPALYPQLYALGRLLRPSRVLEIGTLYGHGVCAVVAGGGGTCAAVHVIDAETYFDGAYLRHGYANIHAMLRYVAGQATLHSRQDAVSTVPAGELTIWKWDTADGLPFHAGETFDLVLVDGDHTYAGKCRDLALAWDVLLPGGYLYVDDVHSMPAVHAAVAAWVTRVRVASVLELFTRTTDRPRGAYVIEKGE